MNIFDVFIFAMNAVFPVIVIILLGYWLKESGFLSKEFLKIGNKTVFRVCLPLLLFCNITELEGLDDIYWEAIIYVLCIIAILVLIGALMATFISDRKQKGVILQCVFRSNFALIGIPLTELIAGEEGVKVAAVLSLFTIPIYNVLAVIALSIYKDDNAKISIKKLLHDIIKNPLIIGVVSGIIVMLIRPYAVIFFRETFLIKMTFLQTAMKYISQISTPLSLMILGGQFDFKRIKGYRKQIIFGTVGRIILSPCLGVGIAVFLEKQNLLRFNGAVFAALIALFGTPVAVSSAIMAEEMKNDGQLAGQLVVWTSLFSVISIFCMILILRGMQLL